MTSSNLQMTIASIMNGGGVVAMPKLALQSRISLALNDAIDTSDPDALRTLVRKLCVTHPVVVKTLEAEMLVPVAEVVAYHGGSESEAEGGGGGASESESNSGSEGSDDGEGNEFDGEEEDEGVERMGEKRKAMSLENGAGKGAVEEEMTARMAKCENCRAYFDVTLNTPRVCRWHQGEKEWCDDDDFWADYDEDCHGRFDDLVDEEDYQEGFAWNCCGKKGGEVGCMRTRHKAAVNASKAVDGVSRRRKL
jgi:hypothetical protein